MNEWLPEPRRCDAVQRATSGSPMSKQQPDDSKTCQSPAADRSGLPRRLGHGLRERNKNVAREDVAGSACGYFVRAPSVEEEVGDDEDNDWNTQCPANHILTHDDFL